jgi:hypothetical protein
MELRLPEVAEVLKTQNTPVEVRNAHSHPMGEVPISKALELVAAGFIGIGNRRRSTFFQKVLRFERKHFTR